MNPELEERLAALERQTAELLRGQEVLVEIALRRGWVMIEELLAAELLVAGPLKKGQYAVRQDPGPGV